MPLPHVNSICLVIDGLQAGMLGAYGNTWVRTPEFDRLAGESFVFDQLLVNDLSDPQIQLCKGRHGLSPDDLPFDASYFYQVQQAGLQMVAIVDDFWTWPRNGMFTERINVPLAPVKRTAPSIEDMQSFALFDTAAEWLDANREPFALWVHCRGLSGPWDAPYELREQFADEEDPPPPDFVDTPSLVLPKDFNPDELLGIQQAYAGQMAAIDTCLGALLDQFRASPLARNTLLTVVGQAGFALGEHGHVGTAMGQLYSELIHVPWLLRCPDGLGAAARSNALMHNCDVVPTLLEWHGLATERQLRHGGRSAWPIVRGEVEQIRDRAVCVGMNEHAIRTAAWHLRVRTPEYFGEPSTELYVKPDDRFEVNDVRDRCPEIATELERVFAETKAAAVAGDWANLPGLPSQLVEHGE